MSVIAEINFIDRSSIKVSSLVPSRSLDRPLIDRTWTNNNKNGPCKVSHTSSWHQWPSSQRNWLWSDGSVQFLSSEFFLAASSLPFLFYSIHFHSSTGISAFYGTKLSDEEALKVLDRAHQLGSTFWVCSSSNSPFFFYFPCGKEREN
jgi:hypothetical protein